MGKSEESSNQDLTKRIEALQEKYHLRESEARFVVSAEEQINNRPQMLTREINDILPYSATYLSTPERLFGLLRTVNRLIFYEDTKGIVQLFYDLSMPVSGDDVLFAYSLDEKIKSRTFWRRLESFYVFLDEPHYQQIASPSCNPEKKHDEETVKVTIAEIFRLANEDGVKTDTEFYDFIVNSYIQSVCNISVKSHLQHYAEIESKRETEFTANYDGEKERIRKDLENRYHKTKRD